VKLQLRVDATNAFNHTNLGQPNGTWSTASTPGEIFTGNGISNTSKAVNSGQITSAKAGGRQLQGGLRLEF
jgi:hypothetical protein